MVVDDVLKIIDGGITYIYSGHKCNYPEIYKTAECIFTKEVEKALDEMASISESFQIRTLFFCAS